MPKCFLYLAIYVYLGRHIFIVMSEGEKKKPNGEDKRQGDLFLLSLLLLLIGAVMVLSMPPDASDFYVVIIKVCAALGGAGVTYAIYSSFL